MLAILLGLVQVNGGTAESEELTTHPTEAYRMEFPV